MSSIIIPRKWQTQPQFPARVDKSGRLFNPTKVSCLLVPSIAQLTDVFNGNNYTYSPTNTPTIAINTFGVGYKWIPVNSSYVEIASDADSVLDTTSCTMIIAEVRTGVTPNGQTSYGYTDSASSRSIIHLPFTDNNCYWDFGNSTANSGRVSTSIASYIAAGTVNIWAFVAGSRGREIWRNGIRLANSTAATATRGTTTLPFRVGASSGIDGGAPPNITNLFFLSKEQLSQSALAELTSINGLWGGVFNRSPQILYFDVGGGGATLTPSLYVDGDTFYAATVSAGGVTLTPSLYSDGDTFHAATVSQSGAPQTLTPDLYADGDTFHSATVGRGAVTLTPSLYADGDTFHSATVAAGSVNLTPSLVTDGDTFHAATVVPGSVTLTPSLVSDGDTFYTHALVLEGGPQTLSPDLVADGDTFHAATVTPGAVTLTPSLYTDPDTFHAAEVASGFNLQPPAYADPDTFYPATVAVGAVSLTPNLFVDGDAFHSPTVSLAGTQTLTPNLFADADTFYVPTLTGGTVILGAARSAGRQLQTGARSNIQTNRR